MTDAGPNRLERALDVYVRFQLVGGGDWPGLLDRHPDLADLLEAFREQPSDDEGAPGQQAAARTVLGDYALGSELGRGGSGTVYEAIDRRLGRRVAVKVLQPELAENPTALARLRREAATLARLDHRGIVRVLGVGAEAGRHWLAMEFVDGESLATRLDRLREQDGHHGDSMRQLVEVVADVADALQHAHDEDIVHRDVKPSNILLRTDGTAVLTDFGIARDGTELDLTRTGAVVGSPHYMAPEQVRGGGSACDARSDVFALGATLYECVTLRRAFLGESIDTVLQAVLTSDPDDPRSLNRAVSPDLAAILWRALEKDPSRRYQTARACGDDLRAFLELREVSVRVPSLLHRWWRRLRRRPAAAALAATAVIALALGSWIVWQLPLVSAAAASERARSYQGEVVAGFLGRGPDRGRAHFERALALDGSRPEAVLGMTFASSRVAGPAAGLAELERLAIACHDVSLDRCRVWLLERIGRADEAAELRARLGPPLTAFELWLEAMCIIEALPSEPDRGREALALLSRAVRVAPQPTLLLDLQWAVVVVQFGDVDTRREVAETLLTLWPDHPLALQQAAVALLKVDPVRAREVMQRAADVGGDDPLLRPNIGIAMAMAGDVEHAVPTIAASFETPGLTTGHRALLLGILEQLDRADVADRLAEQWLQREPDNVEAMRAAARAARRRGDEALGRELLRSAFATAPENRDVVLDLATAALDAGALVESQGLCDALVRRLPHDPQAHELLLHVLAARADHDAQFAELARWLERQPDDVATLTALAALHLSRAGPGDLARALEAAERADYLARGLDGDARRVHADVLERMGETAAAARLRATVAAGTGGR